MGSLLLYALFGCIVLAGVFVGREVVVLLWSQLQGVGLRLERRKAYLRLKEGLGEQLKVEGWEPKGSNDAIEFKGGLPLPEGHREAGDVSLSFSYEIKGGSVWTRCTMSCSGLLPLELSISPKREEKGKWPTALKATKAELDDGFPPAWSANPTYFTYTSVSWNDLPVAPGFRVEGTEEELLAIWDHAHYERLGELLQVFGFEVQHCTIQYSQPGLLDDAQSLLLSERMAEFAALLTLPDDKRVLLTRLRANVEHHPLLDVQQRSLELVQLLAPDAPETLALSRLALASMPLPCQVTAALFLGEEGLLFLKPLLYRQQLPPRIEPGVWRRLIERHDAAVAVEMLESALMLYRGLDGTDTPQREAALLGMLADLKQGEALEFLAQHVRDAKLWPRRQKAVLTVIRAFEVYGGSDQEEPLCELLEVPGWEIPWAAAQGLRPLGTPFSIRKISAQLKRFNDQERRSMQNVINSIRMRFSHLGAGQLAVVEEGTDGELSIAGTEQHEGAVTVLRANEASHTTPESEQP